MLKDRKLLEKYLEEQCDKIVANNDICKSVCIYANQTYDIPKGMVSDLLSRRMSMTETSEFVLFVLLDSLIHILTDQKLLQVNNYYTDKEIQYYKQSKYQNENIKFPLIFKMIQVSDDQWIGRIDVKTLMKLRRAQLVSYNTNAQRTMKRIVSGGKEMFKIDVNQKAVDEIASEFTNRTFIPNTITLNIPMEIESDFYYDEESCSLVIRKLDHFDNTDGFHRYIGAGRASDLDDEFNYSMELRIINFTEDKARHFIHQENKRNKIKDIDAKAMNMNEASNHVVKRLNENMRFNLSGLVNSNKCIIHAGELAELVNYFYFKGIGKEKEKITIIKTVAELIENFNMLTEYNTKYLVNRISFKELLVIMIVFNYYKENQLDKANMCEVIEKTIQKADEIDNKKFYNKTPRKSLIMEIEKLMKGVM